MSRETQWFITVCRSNVSFRKVHGVRFFVISLCICSIIYWYVYTLRIRQSEQISASDGERSSLKARKQFQINGRPFQILSGAVHYFRVHPEYIGC